MLNVKRVNIKIEDKYLNLEPRTSNLEPSAQLTSHDPVYCSLAWK
jgi:hypothetical protein